MNDYKGDTTTIIDEFKVRVTQRRTATTFNDRGDPVDSWGIVTTADIELQPISFKDLVGVESGIKEITTHMVYGFYDTSGNALSVWIGDRFYDSKNNEVVALNEYPNSHFEYMCKYVEGKTSTQDWLEIMTALLKNQYDGDGVTLNFSTTYAFLSGSSMVFLDGVLMEEGSGEDYTEDADLKGVTFTTAPEDDEKIEIRYTRAAFFKNKYTGTGSQTNFDTTYQFEGGTTLVFVDGILKAAGSDYTEDSDLQGVTFTTAPTATEKVEIRYSKYTA